MSTVRIVEVFPSIEAIPEQAYNDLFHHCGGPAYYDRRFLKAAERVPLLPYDAIHYITVTEAGLLTAFLPVYQQSVGVADSLGLLARTTSAGFHSNESALFSHVTHCCDTRILVREPSLDLYRDVISALDDLCRDSDVPQFAIANVADPALLEMAEALGLEVNFSVDRHGIDISSISDADELLEFRIPNKGRWEMRRQRRKAEEYGIRVEIEAPPFANLEEVGELCHDTTARRGTPNYIPAAALARFIAECGDLARIVSVYTQGKRVSVAILLLEAETVHCWLGGMSYIVDTFSPYTVTFEAIFRYAFEMGAKRVEGGRLNERVKQRLGFVPTPLYSIVKRHQRAPLIADATIASNSAPNSSIVAREHAPHNDAEHSTPADLQPAKGRHL